LLLNSRFKRARRDFEKIKETLDEAKRVGEEIRDEEEWISFHDLYYQYFVYHQWRGNVEISLKCLIISYLEELLLTKNTYPCRAEYMLRSFFHADDDFIRRVVLETSRFFDRPLAINHDTIYRKLRDDGLLNVKLAFNWRVVNNELKKRVTRTREEELKKLYEASRKVNEMIPQFIVLKSWNSIDPMYPEMQREMGGGYFLVCNGVGIVIDPGYRYLQQLFGLEAELSIKDIDAVITTHCHDDHTHDFEPIFSLLSKLNKEKTHRISVYASEGTVNKYSSLLRHSNIQTHILEVGRSTRSPRKLNLKNIVFDRSGISLECQPAKHHEKPWMLTDSSVSLMFEISLNDTKRTIGITGDGKYHRALSGFFRKEKSPCDILLVHVGDVDGSGSHLGIEEAGELVGMVGPRIAVLTEFGREFGPDDSRKMTEKMVAMKAKQWKQAADTTILVGDSGLHIRLDTLEILASTNKKALSRKTRVREGLVLANVPHKQEKPESVEMS